ncbi:MAG: galactokinase [Acutalibacteraceae bacterium]|jgi:galactokinase
MTDLTTLKNNIIGGHYEEKLASVYLSAESVAEQRARIAKLLDGFAATYGSQRQVEIFSAPGRTEICGNHTDHNHGKVLAASVNLDALAVVSYSDEEIVRFKAQYNEYEIAPVSLSDLEPKEEEHATSAALVRGVCAEFKRRGYKIGGFNAFSASDVLRGSGVSSSASFEVLIGTILNHLFNDGTVDPVEIAQIGQVAENKFFGKPCGLMDQTASAVGGFVTIDFENPQNPVIEKISFDFTSCGHALVIVNTGGDHAGLTEEYAAVRREMEKVANVFGKQTLREVPVECFEKNLKKIREEAGDRALMRAMHFFAENNRVALQVEALKAGDFEKFKKIVIESGHSSYMYNQNIYLNNRPSFQPVSVALCLSEKLLSGKGAWRVHGGGFAGTIQAFVPKAQLKSYTDEMSAVFGENSCFVLDVRPVGGVKLI